MSAYAPPRGLPFDPALVAAAVGLTVIGTIMVSSSSIAIGDRFAGEPLYYLYQHLGAILIGLVGLICAASIPLNFWYRASWAVLLAGLGLLAVVLLPGIGREVNGSVRWLDLGPVGLQASEPARLALILYLAAYAVRHHADLTQSFGGFVKPMLIVVIAAAMLLAEPDFGAVVVLSVSSVGILFAAGARLRDLTVVAVTGVAALVLIALTARYRVDRIMTFWRPFEDPYNDGFQLVQSLIAIGRGDWLGVGLGESVQKLFYLPEAHTDFVFAVLAEELGLAGSTLVIGLFALLIYRTFAISRRAFAAGLPFHGVLGAGIGITLGVQAGINIGVNTGLLPTKGLTLPLISYGRTSMVVTLVTLGLLLRIYTELARTESVPKRRAPRAAGGRPGIRAGVGG